LGLLLLFCDKIVKGAKQTNKPNIIKKGCGLLNSNVLHEPEILNAASGGGMGVDLGESGWGAAGGSWRGGVEAGGRGNEEEFTYDWYTVGGPEEGEGVRGLGGLGGEGQVYGSGAQKFSKVLYTETFI
jgi:hypothetical protein